MIHAMSLISEQHKAKLLSPGNSQRILYRGYHLFSLYQAFVISASLFP